MDQLADHHAGRTGPTNAAVALAEELSTELEGRSQTVGAALVMVTDDVQGPSWFPDGDIPRLLVNWTVRLRPQ
jgi:hypothetical protein